MQPDAAAAIAARKAMVRVCVMVSPFASPTSRPAPRDAPRDREGRPAARGGDPARKPQANPPFARTAALHAIPVACRAVLR
jgi:hypothetical protein